MEYITIGKRKVEKSFAKFIRIFYLAIGIFITCLGIVLIPVGGLFFIVAGIFFLFLSRKYKKALNDSLAQSRPSAPPIRSDDFSSDVAVSNNSDLELSGNIDEIHAPHSDVESSCHKDEVYTPNSDAPQVKKLTHIVGNFSGTPASQVDNHKIAGVFYHSFAVEQLLDDYDCVLKRGKKISIGKTSLAIDSSNIYDSNAIQVFIDDYLVGYIKKGSCSRVLKMISNDLIHHLTSSIYRGDDDASGDPSYYITLTIYLCDK